MTEERKVNTIGRIPATAHYTQQEDKMELKMFGEEGYEQRITGRFRGYTDVISVDSEGIKFRTDSYAVPEMWLEATIPWSVIREALEEKKRISKDLMEEVSKENKKLIGELLAEEEEWLS